MMRAGGLRCPISDIPRARGDAFSADATEVSDPGLGAVSLNLLECASAGLWDEESDEQDTEDTDDAEDREDRVLGHLGGHNWEK